MNDILEMEENIRACLDEVPDIQIRRFAFFYASFSSSCLICHSYQICRQISFDLSVLTPRVCQVLKLHRQTGNVMAIAFSTGYSCRLNKGI
jgi:hypothetical protein